MFMFWKIYVLELLSCVQLRFVTFRHVTFTLCCFTLCSNIYFGAIHNYLQYLLKITLSAGFLILKVGNFQSQTLKQGLRTHFLKNEANVSVNRWNPSKIWKNAWWFFILMTLKNTSILCDVKSLNNSQFFSCWEG